VTQEASRSFSATSQRPVLSSFIFCWLFLLLIVITAPPILSMSWLVFFLRYVSWTIAAKSERSYRQLMITHNPKITTYSIWSMPDSLRIHLARRPAGRRQVDVAVTKVKLQRWKWQVSGQEDSQMTVFADRLSTRRWQTIAENERQCQWVIVPGPEPTTVKRSEVETVSANYLPSCVRHART